MISEAQAEKTRTALPLSLAQTIERMLPLLQDVAQSLRPII